MKVNVLVGILRCYLIKELKKMNKYSFQRRLTKNRYDEVATFQKLACPSCSMAESK